MRSRCLKVLIIGYVWPEIRSSAAGLRSWNLVKSFLEAEWQVIFASPSQENQYSQELNQFGIPTCTVQANDPSFDTWIRELNPDYVIFDRFVVEEQFGWRVEENCPEAIRIVDTQDLHFLRRGRERALKESKTLDEISHCQFDLRSDDCLRELASIYRSDCSLILSDFELKLLTHQFQIPENHLFLSRFHYPEISTTPGFSERENFVVIGNFRHPPNLDGVKWLKNEIWPLIRHDLSSAQVHIYGAYPSKEVMNLSDQKNGFLVRGPAPDQFQTLRKYRVNLAPLRFGAGIKGKISDGWWSGTPVISTEIGKEGMSEDLPWGGDFANDPVEFAKKAVTLYQNEIHWTQSQKNGFQILRTLYCAQKNSKLFIDQMFHLKKNVELSRKSNIVGSMLRFHHHRSTKYFSKWIEAKNTKGLSPSNT